MFTSLRARAPYGGLALALLLAACSTPAEQTAIKSSDSSSKIATADAGRATGREAIGSGPASPFASGADDRVFFALDHSDLSATARGTVGKWGDYLRSQPSRSLMIEGHADERGTREYNLALGERRAQAVREYLLTIGVKPTQLRTASFGKERPAEVGSSEEAWSKNRRAVAVVD